MDESLIFDSVTRRTKKDKPPSALRLLLAGTVERLRDRRYRHLPNPTARNRQLAKDADVSQSQIERIIGGQLGTSVDVIDALARALNVKPQDMITPYFFAESAQEKTEERDLLRRRQGT